MPCVVPLGGSQRGGAFALPPSLLLFEALRLFGTRRLLSYSPLNCVDGKRSGAFKKRGLRMRGEEGERSTGLWRGRGRDAGAGVGLAAAR